MSKPEWALAFEARARFDNHKPLLLRKGVRYNLARLQTEAVKGVPADPPDGFAEFYEQQDDFDGWDNWGVTWDVGDPYKGDERGSADPLVVVPRFQSINEEWEAVLDGHFRADTISARKRARIIRMRKTPENGSEDNL